MPRGVAHEDRVRAAALADVLVGMSLTAAAAKHQVSKATLIKWRNDAGLHGGVEPQKTRDELGELLAGYIRANIAALTAHAEFAKKEDWLIKQSAADLAVFDGVLFDKLARLLEALRGSAAGDGRSELSAAAVEHDPASAGRPAAGG